MHETNSSNATGAEVPPPCHALLTGGAGTGKAACNVHRATMHTAFKLQIGRSLEG
jgi:hypothetical protein